MRKLLSGSGPAGAGPDSPGSCDDEHSQGASSFFPGLSTLPGPLTPFYTNIATLPASLRPLTQSRWYLDEKALKNPSFPAVLSTSRWTRTIDLWKSVDGGVTFERMEVDSRRVGARLNPSRCSRALGSRPHLAEFRRQLDLLTRIRDKITEIHDAIRVIRSVTEQVQDLTARLAARDTDGRIRAKAEAIDEQLSGLEGRLLGGEPLSTPQPTLASDFGWLSTMVSSADAQPTEIFRAVPETSATS